MANPSKISQTVRKLLGQTSGKPVSLAAERVLQVFREHGVEAAQISRLLPQIGLDDLHTPEKLLAILTPNLIDQIATLFGVRSQWLEGCDDRIYDYLATYKEPQRLLDHLRALWQLPAWKNEVHTPLRILTTTKCLDYRDDRRYELAPVLLEPIASLGDETIYRYHIYQDGFSWDHTPARLELKAIGRTVWNALEKRIPLYLVSPKEMDEVLEGRCIPRSLLHSGYLPAPSFEDYFLDNTQSVAAREADELPAVFDYMVRTRLNGYDFKTVAIDDDTESEPTPTPETPPASQPVKPSAPGKRDAQREIWRAIEEAATTIWATEFLTIQDMVRRLRMLPHLETIRFTDDTLRKGIRHLAPDGIRGKPGRKPKQSG